MGYTNSDGSGLVGALNPALVGQALLVDGGGNLRVTTTGAASGGSDGQTPGSVPLTEVGLFNGTSVDRWQGLNGAASVQDWVRQLTMQGKAYSALAQINGAAGTFPLALFNASTARNMLVYSVKASTGTGGASVFLQATTTNPAFTTSVTPLNRKGGGAASLATCTTTTTSQSNPATNVLEVLNSGNLTALTDLMGNGASYLLPASANNGLTVFIQAFASGLSAMCVSWVEF